MRILRLAILTVIVAAFAEFTPSRAAAADHAVVLPYLAADVADIGYLDLTKVDLPAALDELFGMAPLPDDEKARAKMKAAAMQSVFKEMTDRGVRRVYVPFRISDIQQGGPSCVIEIAEGGDPKLVIELLTGLLGPHDGSHHDNHPRAPSVFESVDGAVLGAVSEEQLKTLKHSRVSKPRQEAVDALEALAGAEAGVVVFGDADGRRVVREMVPPMPAPFAEIDGRMLADGVKWIAVTMKLPPKPVVTLAVNASDGATVATLDQAAAKAIELLKMMCMARMISGPPAHRDAGMVLPLIPYLKPKIDGNHLSITLGDDDEEVKFLCWFVPTMLKGEREKSAYMHRMNSFKQIALAMQNYEAAKKSLPAAASYSADGRPLLSWRVHILPYIEQQSLYDQFHLDEPWDSEHNSKLIGRMPPLYADADPAVRRAAEDGRTTYLVPTGEGTVFSGREGVKFSQIKDGMSNTVLLVNVVPERAVVWTKPEDWEVDMKDPLRGIKPAAGAFAVAFCDGSVSLIDGGVDPTEFAKKLTRAGNEAAAK